MVASDFLIAGNDEHGLNPPTVGKRTPFINYIGRSFYENEFNKEAKNQFLLACLRCGFNIIDVHPEIQDISVSTRVVRTNRARPTLLVTFAYNASGDGNSFNSARGLEVYYSRLNPYPERSRELSQDVYNSIINNSQAVGRFVGTLSVGVLNNVNCPSTLIEAGFMTNFGEAKLMLNPDYVLSIAEGACRGVCEFLNVDYVERSLNNFTTIRQGDRGNFVKILQYLLNSYGYSVDTDGVFGPKTKEAVIAFQKNNGLVQDGIVGRNTWDRLLNINPDKLVLRRGDRASAVEYLQRILLSYLYPISSLDGVFGPETERAVRSFQQENGLTVDGVVGPNTWRAIRATTGRPLQQ